jgi:hypothetical protein
MSQFILHGLTTSPNQELYGLNLLTIQSLWHFLESLVKLPQTHKQQLWQRHIRLLPSLFRLLPIDENISSFSPLFVNHLFDEYLTYRMKQIQNLYL